MNTTEEKAAARHWVGKSKGMPLGYRIFVFILRTLCVYPAYSLLVFVVLYYFLFSMTTTRHSYNFFRLRCGFSVLKSWWKVYVSYFMIGQVIIDKVVVTSGLSKQFTFKSNGAENMVQIRDERRGGILLGAHLGNWEIAGHAFNRYSNLTVNIVLYDGESEQIKKYMEGVMGNKKSFHIIPIKNDLSHVYLMSEALERGELICMHADRFMEGNRTQLVKFFGEEARLPSGPFQLVKSLKAPYTFVYGVKNGATHYDLFCRPLRHPRQFANVQEMMNDYAQDLEGMVKQYPEQWFNYYDFWEK